jgi:hypothetical protein
LRTKITAPLRPHPRCCPTTSFDRSPQSRRDEELNENMNNILEIEYFKTFYRSKIHRLNFLPFDFFIDPKEELSLLFLFRL